jgi:hypothetical protein
MSNPTSDATPTPPNTATDTPPSTPAAPFDTRGRMLEPAWDYVAPNRPLLPSWLGPKHGIATILNSDPALLAVTIAREAMDRERIVLERAQSLNRPSLAHPKERVVAAATARLAAALQLLRLAMATIGTSEQVDEAMRRAHHAAFYGDRLCADIRVVGLDCEGASDAS